MGHNSSKRLSGISRSGRARPAPRRSRHGKAPMRRFRCQEAPLRPRIKRVGMVETGSPVRAVVRNVLVVVCVVLVLYVIYLLRQPISWLVIAAFLAIALAGPVNFFQRYMKRGLAIALVYLTLLAIPIGLGA